MIKELSEIDTNNLLITPAFSQVVFKNGSTLQLDPQRLAITSFGQNELPYRLAESYCKALPFINCVATGINFDYIIEGIDFDKWFTELKSIKFKNTVTKAIDFSFSNDDGSTCLVKVQMNSNMQPTVTFNYHMDYNDKILSEIDNDFVNQWKVYLSLNIEFLNRLFV